MLGDIITSYNDNLIDLSSDLPHLVGRTKADSSVNLGLVRGGKTLTIAVVIGKLAQDDLSRTGNTGQVPKQGNSIGIDVIELERADLGKLGVESGVLVQSVEQGPGRQAGIQRGDVITDLDGESITSIVQFERVVAGLPPGVAVHIRIVRAGTPEFLALKLPPG
jgi:serine protease Do